MKNENCLEGLRCPKCGQNEALDITCNVVMRVYDDGTDSQRSGYEWDDSDHTTCPKCRFGAALSEFREPCPITINGVEVPAPVCEPLERGARYYLVYPTRKGLYVDAVWTGSSADVMWLKRGLVHRTKAAAEALIQASGGTRRTVTEKHIAEATTTEELHELVWDAAREHGYTLNDDSFAEQAYEYSEAAHADGIDGRESATLRSLATLLYAADRRWQEIAP